MEYLYQLISRFSSDAHITYMFFVVFVFLTVLITGASLIVLLFELKDPIHRRIRLVTGKEEKKSSWSVDSIANTVRPLASYVIPKKFEELSKINAKLIVAGFRSQNARVLFYSIKTLSLIIVLAVTTITGFTMLGWPSKNMFLIIGGAAFVGMVGPGKVLDHIIANRQKKLRNAFPDALDLLVVCSEAGLGLNAAFARVAEEIYASHPILAEELALVNVEIQAGVDRTTALNNLGNRTGLEDISGLVSSLSQAARFGASIAATLRVYSDDLRDKRTQAAEEKAAKLGTKMIFPLVSCLWPGFFAVAVGPAAIKLVQAFSQMKF